MKWKKVNNVCLEAPGYTVAKYRVIRDGSPVWLYRAIRLGRPSVVLHEAMEAGPCKAACVADSKSSPT